MVRLANDDRGPTLAQPMKTLSSGSEHTGFSISPELFDLDADVTRENMEYLESSAFACEAGPRLRNPRRPDPDADPRRGLEPERHGQAQGPADGCRAHPHDLLLVEAVVGQP